jgi:phosphoribosylformylglycinamidine synthase
MPPTLNLERERAVQACVRTAIDQGLLRSAHDCSEGGLAVAIAECALSSTQLLGATIDLAQNGLRADSLLFGESQSRIVVSVKPEDTAAVRRIAGKAGVPCAELGTVCRDLLTITVRDHAGKSTRYIERDCARLSAMWRGALQEMLATSIKAP